MKRIIALLLTLTLLTGAAYAEGLLPGFTGLFGVEMPSLTAVILRYADEEAAGADGSRVVTYHNVTEAELDAFSVYMEDFGCALTDYSVEGSVLTAVIGKQGASFSFTYDTASGDCVLAYPAGTNEEDEKELMLARWQTGAIVTFGTYPQTKSGTDSTPIEWIVLENDGETALLISRYALDAKPYNTEYTSVTWATCTLRKWLNGTFYNRAFSASDKKYIVESKVTADKNPSYSTNPGKATTDNVYLLSITEVNKYFENDAARMCAPTDYAVKNGAWTSSSYKADNRACGWWWLRSPGSYGNYAANVSSDGVVNDFGRSVDYGGSVVRPVVRVRLF